MREREKGRSENGKWSCLSLSLFFLCQSVCFSFSLSEIEPSTSFPNQSYHPYTCIRLSLHPFAPLFVRVSLPVRSSVTRSFRTSSRLFICPSVGLSVSAILFRLPATRSVRQCVRLFVRGCWSVRSSVPMYTCLSAGPHVRLSLSTPVCQQVRMFVSPSVRLSVSRSASLTDRPQVCHLLRQSVGRSIHIRAFVTTSVHQYVCPFVCPCPFVSMSVRSSVSLSVNPSCC